MHRRERRSPQCRRCALAGSAGRPSRPRHLSTPSQFTHPAPLTSVGSPTVRSALTRRPPCCVSRHATFTGNCARCTDFATSPFAQRCAGNERSGRNAMPNSPTINCGEPGMAASRVLRSARSASKRGVRPGIDVGDVPEAGKCRLFGRSSRMPSHATNSPYTG